MTATIGPALKIPFTIGSSAIVGQGNFPIVGCRYTQDDVSVASPAWVDISDRLKGCSTSRGRATELDQFDAGTAEIYLNNRDRALDPIVNTGVRPMNRVQLYAEFSGSIFPIFTGYAEAWQQTYPDGGWSDAIATLRAVDEFKVLALSALPASGTISGGVYSSVQINQLLDLVANHAPRLIDRGASLDASDSRSLTGQSAKSEVDLVVSLDYALLIQNPSLTASAFFVGNTGTLIDLQGDHRAVGANRYTTAQATFGDAGGTELPYLTLTTDSSDSFLYNNITITPSSGSAVNKSDAISIAAYGKRDLSQSLPVVSSEAGFIADRLLAKYKDPKTRVTTIQPNMADADTALSMLGLDLMDCIRVLRTPPGGGSRFDQTLYVQRIEFSQVPGEPLACSLGVSPL